LADAALPDELADTSLGKALTFIIEQFRQGVPASEEELASRFSPYAIAASGGGGGPADRLRRFAATLPGFVVRGYRKSSDRIGFLDVRSQDGRDSVIGVKLYGENPGLIVQLIVAACPPGFTVRPATPADADSLAALELETPIVIGDLKIVYDRSRDYFEAERMTDGKLYVIEREGEVVGLTANVVHHVRIAGRTMPTYYMYRARVRPDAQGGGVRGLIILTGFEASGTDADFPYGFIAQSNVAGLKRPVGMATPWLEPAELLVIDTAGCPPAGLGRVATEDEADWLVDLLNDAHSREELFVPYTTRSLGARLSREPASYGWPNFLVSERAAVGVWAPRMGVIVEENGVETRDVRALVLDYGCTADGVDELIGLIADWRHRLAAERTTELTLFTSAASRGSADLAALAKRRHSCVVNCRAPPADGVAQRGVYVDQLYF